MPSRAQSTHRSLLERLRGGEDEQAWREFSERYRDLLLRYALRRGLPIHDAEDVVQASMLKLATRLKSFVYRPELGTFRAYLGRVVENEIRRVRGRRRPVPVDLEDAGEPEPQADPELEQLWHDSWTEHHFRLALDTVRDAVSPLSLRVFEGLLDGADPNVIAEREGTPVANVYKIKQRMRDRLRDAVADQLEREEFREHRS
ncbi:MAG: sigma-70 family RNA polymerase sigma factor [Planctomycetota bacterium]